MRTHVLKFIPKFISRFIVGFSFAFLSTGPALSAGTCGQSVARLVSPLLPLMESAVNGESLSLRAQEMQRTAFESLPPAAARELQQFLASENSPVKHTQPQQVWAMGRNGALQGWLIAFKSERTSREYLVQYGLLALSAQGQILGQNLTRWLRPRESINHLAELAEGKAVTASQLPQGLSVREVANPAEVLPREILDLYVTNPAQQAKHTVYRIENGEGLVGYQVLFQLSSARLRAQERSVSVFLDRALRPVARHEIFF